MAIHADLMDDLIVQNVQTTLGNRLAALAGFSTDFSDVVEDTKGATMTVGLSSGNTVVDDPTDYEVGDSNLTPIAVALTEKNVSWNISNKDWNSSSVARIENNLQANLNNLADSIWDVIAALITTANFGANAVTAAQTAFDADALKTLWAAVPKTNKVCLLDSVAYSEVMPTDKNGFELSVRGAHGFDSISHVSKWDAAGANIYGFAGGKEAFAIGSKLPDIPMDVSEQLSTRVPIEIPSLGMTVLFCRWGSAKTRKSWASLGVYFGAGVGQAAAGAIAASA